MFYLLAPSTESPRERQLVTIGAVLLHVALAWLLLQPIGRGVDGDGNISQSDGDALVVEFVSVTSDARGTSSILLPVSQDAVASGQQKQTPASGTTTPDVTTMVAAIQSKTGEFAASNMPPGVAGQSLQATSSAAKAGIPESDLLTNYRAALRAKIARTWSSLTDRSFPSDCSLQLSLNPGGALAATSANGCNLSQEDRLQLEAAALMAQPLPYAGYETVFQHELSLVL